MAANTFERNQELCEKYAHFASHLDRWHFKILYWSMFILNLVILFLASWMYTRGQGALEKYSHDSRQRNKRLRKYVLLCFGCVVVSALCVVMEAYALLALQFCDGEDLMNIYWATWTMIQVGGWIAMMGIILALAHTLRNRKHPPWALALGTPVLVIAGILHLIHDCTKKRVKQRLSKPAVAPSMTSGPSSSEVNTIQVSSEEDIEIQGDLIGFTINGGPIVRFNAPINLVRGLETSGEVLGFLKGDQPLVAFEKNVRFLKAQEREETPTTRIVPTQTTRPQTPEGEV